MGTLKLRKWDTVEHLKTEEDMVMYLEACMEEAGDDAAFIATRRSPAKATQALPPSSRSCTRWASSCIRKSLTPESLWKAGRIRQFCQDSNDCPSLACFVSQVDWLGLFALVFQPV